MKKITLLLTILVSSFSLTNTQAQVSLGVNINIGRQPVWGPVGYDYVENYYIPDIDAYYNVPRRQYTYLDGNRWVTAVSLPVRYRSYDLYKGYKVVVNEKNPYNNAAMYRAKYASYKGKSGQLVIRNSHEQKYFQNKNHPEHSKWKGNNGNGNSKGNGNGNSKKGKGKS